MTAIMKLLSKFRLENDILRKGLAEFLGTFILVVSYMV